MASNQQGTTDCRVHILIQTDDRQWNCHCLKEALRCIFLASDTSCPRFAKDNHNLLCTTPVPVSPNRYHVSLKVHDNPNTSLYPLSPWFSTSTTICLRQQTGKVSFCHFSFDRSCFFSFDFRYNCFCDDITTSVACITDDIIVITHRQCPVTSEHLCFVVRKWELNEPDKWHHDAKSRTGPMAAAAGFV